MNDLPYSYHTFLFPFVWNDKGNLSRGEFEKVLSQKHWYEIGEEDIAVSKGEPYKFDYALYQYLTIPARKFVFPQKSDKDALVHNFEFRYNGNKNSLSDEGEYIITKGKEVFTLRFNGIRLKIFTIGIAILILETEYYGDKYVLDSDETTKAFCLEDINKINEFGRRVNLPFIGSEENPCSVAADEIAIRFSRDKAPLHDHFKEVLVRCAQDGEELSLTYIMKPIKDILTIDSNSQLTTKREDKDEKNQRFYIYPATDDRMFVCCLVRNDELCIKFSQWGYDKYKYLSSSSSVGTTLYKFAFIENNCNCQSKIMSKKLFVNGVNNRWIDYKTLYAVTHYSLMAVTGEEDALRTVVVNPFLTQYVQLSILALAQRAAILLFSARAADVASNLNAIDLSKIAKIDILQKNYVQMQNQILIYEATTQEQGVELFQMLIKQLHIKENKAELDGQISNLRDAANISHSRIELRSLSWLTIILALFAFLTLGFMVFLPYNEIAINIIAVVLIVGTAPLFLINVYHHYNNYYKNCKKRK